MSSTNKTTYYELSQYVGTDKPTYLSDYNADMLKIDTGIHDAASDASTALTTANSAASVAADAATAASTATTTANSANITALEAKSTAETAATNAAAALDAASDAEEAAAANTIENLAPAYDPTLTYDVGDLVTYIDAQGSGKLYKCIIAVTTPEAFNINKWDDVTTSKVYSQKKILTVSLSNTTYQGVVDEMLTHYSEVFNFITNNIAKGIVCVISRYSGDTLVAQQNQLAAWSGTDFELSFFNLKTSGEGYVAEKMVCSSTSCKLITSNTTISATPSNTYKRYQSGESDTDTEYRRVYTFIAL